MLPPDASIIESAALVRTMSGFFYNLGRKMGHAVIPTIRKSKWIWNGLTGTDEEALRAEQLLGATLSAELRAATVPGADPEAAQRVSEISRRLEDNIKPPRCEYSCEIIHDAFPNAIALPGGFIFISDSLVGLVENSDQLAFVIGHEMAHVIRRDAWNRMLNQAMVKAASAVAMRAGHLGTWLRQNGLEVLRSAHDRDREFEADDLGLRLAVAAGFDPGAAIILMQRITALGPDPGTIGKYFSSHPPAAERIARLESLQRRVVEDRA